MKFTIKIFGKSGQSRHIIRKIKDALETNYYMMECTGVGFDLDKIGEPDRVIRFFEEVDLIFSKNSQPHDFYDGELEKNFYNYSSIFIDLFTKNEDLMNKLKSISSNQRIYNGYNIDDPINISDCNLLIPNITSILESHFYNISSMNIVIDLDPVQVERRFSMNQKMLKVCDGCSHIDVCQHTKSAKGYQEVLDTILKPEDTNIFSIKLECAKHESLSWAPFTPNYLGRTYTSAPHSKTFNESSTSSEDFK